MEAEDKVELVEQVLDVAQDEEMNDSHALARILVTVLGFVEDSEELNSTIAERDKAQQEVKTLKACLDVANNSVNKLRVELSAANDRSKGHLTEARDQAVAELNKVQKELDDIRQNGGNERVEKLLKAKISVWEQEYEERIKYLKELNDKTIQDLVARSKELDNAKWEIAQLNKELALYRPKPEAKP